MHYIILDLEWNSAYSRIHERFVNEIIEIGAIKLDENFKEIDRFQVFIRSCLTKRLSSRVKGLTNITNEDMRSGIPFEKAIRQYSDWAGNNHVTLSWSNTDIYVMLDNLKSFMGLSTIPFIERYADLQKFVQRKMNISGNQIALTAAAEQMGVNFSEFAAHRALGDCLMCAELLRRTYIDGEMDDLIIDTTNPEYYKRINFKSYIISDINNPEIDHRQLRFRCEKCNRYARRSSKWQFKNKSFRADFNCKNCGNTFTARIRFKRIYDGVIINRSIISSQPTQNSTICDTENLL